MPERSKSHQLKGRLTPPKLLPDREATVFRSIIGAVDPQFFNAADLPLLVEYCRAVVQADDAAAAIAQTGAVVDGKASPWIVVQEKTQRALVALAARLRICPQSRFDRLKAGSHSRDQMLNRMNDDDDPLAKFRPGPAPKLTGLASFRKP